MEEFDITVSKHQIGIKGAKIAVIGVGGAGGNMLDLVAKSGIGEDVKLVAANTDAQALNGCSADTKILLGPNVTHGKGAGMNPELGKKAALESYNEIKEALMQ
ncbi:MAG: cell division protein FtsZ [Sulfurovum sp.]|nr:cell division protein FtsZ [Sulfurovum sp.]